MCVRVCAICCILYVWALTHVVCACLQDPAAVGSGAFTLYREISIDKSILEASMAGFRIIPPFGPGFVHTDLSVCKGNTGDAIKCRCGSVHQF